ncbi:MAG: ClpXP protease specificity-enhancing factor SspB [Pseudomonadota bacterium]
MPKTIDYSAKMMRAMKGLMREVLEDIADTGLPGNHHFYISFQTPKAGVVLADWLREKYPEEMTIVLQNWFDNLTILPDRFSVTLNFGDNTEDLVIPFDAINSFVDPSVDFGLSFVSETEEIDEVLNEAPMATDVEPEDDEGPKEAEVVSLDQFRKRDR